MTAQYSRIPGSDTIGPSPRNTFQGIGLPGLRVGWCLAAPDVLERLVRLRDYTTLALSPLVEHVATRAIEGADLLFEPRFAQARHNLDELVRGPPKTVSTSVLFVRKAASPFSCACRTWLISKIFAASWLTSTAFFWSRERVLVTRLRQAGLWLLSQGANGGALTRCPNISELSPTHR